MTSAAGRVQIAWTSIADRLEEFGWDDLYLLLAAQGDPESLAQTMAHARAALEHANATVENEAVQGRDVDPSPLGAVVWVDYIESEEGLRTWIAALAQDLDAAGWSGVVRAHPQVWLPDWLSSRPVKPRVTGFAAYRRSQGPQIPERTPLSTARWAVNELTTRNVSQMVLDWQSFAGATTYLSTGRAETLMSESVSAEMLVEALHLGGRAGVTCLQQHPFRLRSSVLSWWGQLVLQTDDDQAGWQERIDSVRGAMTGLPEELDLAFIRQLPQPGFSWQVLADPSLPRLSASDLVRSRHLWNHYAPDVHGVQVLTDAHLARVGNLDDWVIETLAPGRYLVQASDLAAWYSSGSPDPDLLSAARRDFADMIFTPALVESSLQA